MTSEETDSSQEAERNHTAKMAKIKSARDKIIAKKTIEKDLLIVHTGKGKGKTSAAIGLAVRAIGNNMRVLILQFVKGGWETGERKILEKHFGDLCEIKAMGEGFTWETQNRARDILCAEKAWQYALDAFENPAWDMVILDELNIILRYGYLECDTILPFLVNRRKGLHIVVTGRNAPDPLIEAADLVTEMTQIKHPFRSGVKAQRGIEF